MKVAVTVVEQLKGWSGSQGAGAVGAGGGGGLVLWFRT